MGVVIGNTEFAYFNMPATGPVPNTTYPVQDTRLVDYFASKRMTILRLMFSWEGMQSSLPGVDAAGNITSPGAPIPGVGNFKAYFDNYKRIVDYATNVRGMAVVIEPWDSDTTGGAGGFVYRGARPANSQFADFWAKMASNFKTNPRVSYGLMNEPNRMSTMVWWSAAQAGISAIRSTGSTQRIYVPGNGWTNASTWTQSWYDQGGSPQRSNAYGYLNANGVNQALTDPLNNMVIEVHTYLDANQGGNANDISSVTAARDQLTVAVTEAKAHGYRIYLGEMGIVASQPNAKAAWDDFISYLNATPEIVAYTWFAAGSPAWWPDVNAPHFSISPTNPTTFTGDTINMSLIQGSF